MKKIGLFFGSFNPFHVGHKIIGSYMSEFSDLNQVWFVVSPQNPLKIKKSLLHEYHRLMIIRMEVEDNPKLSVSDIEFNLSQPNYTIDTLTYLKERYPKYIFSLIMGSDNFNSINKWKNHKEILKHYPLYVYLRPGFPINDQGKNINIIKDVPQMDISSSFLRKKMKEGYDISYMIPEKAWKYIDEMNFYK